MKKFWIQVTVLVVVILGATYFSFNQNSVVPIIPGFKPILEKKQIKINQTVINVEVADNDSSKRLGLGGRESLAADSGMLFIYSEEKVYKFWMKGMKIPLDFIFIRNGEVIDILKNIPPPTEGQDAAALPIYQPIEPIDMLLEVNAGFTDAQDIQVGDKMYLVNSNELSLWSEAQSFEFLSKDN